jgi:hypothetical protein
MNTSTMISSTMRRPLYSRKHLASKLSASQTHQETTGNEEVKPTTAKNLTPVSAVTVRQISRITIQKLLPSTGIHLFTVSHLLPAFKAAVVIYDVSASLPSVYTADVGYLYLDKCIRFLQGYLYYPRPNYYYNWSASFATFLY